MSLSSFLQQLPDYAKDIRLNLSTILTEEGAPDLTLNQIHGIALASAYATRHPAIIEAITAETANTLSATEVTAAKIAATLMGMNNIYYRFVHLVSDKEYAKLPARLRMNGLASHGIDKKDFELYSLAVSAINGCGMCIEAHVHEAEKSGISKTGIQSSIRIAAVLQATAQALAIA